ncbi:hypothetical protein [Achromobacter sp. UMC46]|uniref:hypothetical protein n=1 Tax=Achromobacter sp. UMC46 TaxID=1862319 RepID=UPI0016032CC3|nr:hypothetical protein [Achromobacter sp. UMC46]
MNLILLAFIVLLAAASVVYRCVRRQPHDTCRAIARNVLGGVRVGASGLCHRRHQGRRPAQSGRRRRVHAAVPWRALEAAHKRFATTMTIA